MTPRYIIIGKIMRYLYENDIIIDIFYDYNKNAFKLNIDREELDEKMKEALSAEEFKQIHYEESDAKNFTYIKIEGSYVDFININPVFGKLNIFGYMTETQFNLAMMQAKESGMGLQKLISGNQNHVYSFAISDKNLFGIDGNFIPVRRKELTFSKINGNYLLSNLEVEVSVDISYEEILNKLKDICAKQIEDNIFYSEDAVIKVFNRKGYILFSIVFVDGVYINHLESMDKMCGMAWNFMQNKYISYYTTATQYSMTTYNLITQDIYKDTIKSGMIGSNARRGQNIVLTNPFFCASINHDNFIKRIKALI